MADPAQNGVTPSTLFESIGTKVASLGTAPNGAADHDDESKTELKAVEEIESLCMNCHENGTTRLLLTSIPYFREIIIMSFACDHCGFANNEVQPAGMIQPRGIYYELRPTELEDLNRQVVKSDTATVRFIELDLEIPPGRGRLTNVEGLLSGIADDLELGQAARLQHDAATHAKVGAVIDRVRTMLAGGAFPFRLCVDDPAGNSFITPDLRDGVGKWEKHEYDRTGAQNAFLGLASTNDGAALGEDGGARPGSIEDDIVPNEVYTFPSRCPGCSRPCATNMKMVDIPHFRQVVLMSVVCDDCGFRSSEVKTGGEIPERGERTVLKVRRGDPVDLSRDILKSETCALECPELNLSVNAGTLGGRFTTVEGLLTQVRDDLRSQIFEADDGSGVGGSDISGGGGQGGDSLATGERARWDSFFDGLDAAIRGERDFTIIMTDPIASSFVQPLTDPPEADPQITREQYDRTEEEKEELGLLDMKVEGYEAEAGQDEGAASGPS